MKILFATPEAAPYWKTGGLADVSRALPDALAARGHDVLLIHPFYRAVREQALPLRELDEVDLPWPGGGARIRYLLHESGDGAPAVLVEHPAFDVEHPYLDLPDDRLAAARRFGIFSRAVLERALAWKADVVHLNDWPTGLVPLYAHIAGVLPATVFAIHNLAYQGNFPPGSLPQLGIPWEWFRPENGLEFYGSASFLKAGLALADRLVTVSPTYAEEIQTPEFGAGMDGLLRFRRRSLAGILNGIDPQTWNPAADPALAEPYTARSLEGKDANRDALVRELGLEGEGPVVAMVSRLVYQKGIDLLLHALPELVGAGVRLAVLGDGEPDYEEALLRAEADHPGRVRVRLGFDDGLARRLYGGADFFLMPSRYEPCGLGQLIAQRYGTVPIVRRTGGLADTVTDGKTGFSFDEATSQALVAAVVRAASAWRARGWTALRRRCMDLDRSWTASAVLYEELYRLAAGSLD